MCAATWRLPLQVTERVALLSRWVAADLYAKEIDILQFELSMSQCNVDLWEQVVPLLPRAEKAGVWLAARLFFFLLCMMRRVVIAVRSA